jgi:hypothetical protein
MTLPECFTWCKDCHRKFSKWKSPPAKWNVPLLDGGKISAYKRSYKYTGKFLLGLSEWTKWPATITYPPSSDPSSGGGICQTLAYLLSLCSKTCNNCPRLGYNMLSCSTLHKEEGDHQRQQEGRRRSSVKPKDGVIPKIRGLGWWVGSPAQPNPTFWECSPHVAFTRSKAWCKGDEPKPNNLGWKLQHVISGTSQVQFPAPG